MIYLGIDFGTSGARAIAINNYQEICAELNYPWQASQENNLTQAWEEALLYLIGNLSRKIRKSLKAIAINGTSSTVILCDSKGTPITEPLLYNDNRGKSILPKIREIAPANHLVLSSTSSLAKLFWWSEQKFFTQASYFLHQADWLAFLLHGKIGISDYHNALKLGYDVQNLCYPDWLLGIPYQALLPEILAPGTAIAPIQSNLSEEFNIPNTCIISTGTTDSIAAFIACGVSQPGEAVTSLGSTLVLKLLSENYVENLDFGIYSHRFGDFWLTGGASNTGGAVLKNFFTPQDLTNLSQQIDPYKSSNLQYYPLLTPGERFPINDPQLPPKLTPLPENPSEFLHGLLTGIASIEARGYRLLQEYGATPLTKVFTAGGGAQNYTWQVIRELQLQVPVLISPHTEAAYGSAILAMKSCEV